MTSDTRGQMYRPEDAAIRCSDRVTCDALKGRRLWVTINHNSICSDFRDHKTCRKVPPGFSFVVLDVITHEYTSQYFVVRTNDGKRGYVSLSNSHLLTFKDPRPAAAAVKRKQEADAAAKRKQEEADSAALAAMPRADLEKDCILTAAEHLPRIPGIAIAGSRVSALPPELELKPDPLMYATIVHIDAMAVGQSVTYNFLCARGARTPTMIQRLVR